MSKLWQGTTLALAVTLLSGCEARKPRTADPDPGPRLTQGKRGAIPDGPESLSEFMQKVRHLSANARPGSARGPAATLEALDPEFAAEVALAASAPTGERLRNVAERYRERGVLDAAHQHFNRAVALNRRDAAAYEGLARVWRDWGLPHLAVGDAHRAAFYAPHSASAQNTLGTIMQALGRHKEARSAYQLASWLDPQAAYAVNNLCYLSFVNGGIDTAIETCAAALELDPSLTAARNNLALAYAAAGRMDMARAQFLDAGDRASGLYNTGIAYLAAGDDGNALSAFDAASKARPTLNLARERARQIRERLHLRTVADRIADAAGR